MEKKLQKIPGTLVGVDGNAFSLLGTFRRDARRAGWPQEEIGNVLAEAMSGNYDKLVSTLGECYEN